MKSDHSPECYKCADRMTDADIDAESPMGDALCIKCRKTREANLEEEAVASFCQHLRNPVAAWFADIITGCGFKFTRSIPQDASETPTALFFTQGSLQIQCHSALTRATLTKPCASFPTQPDWVIEFHLSTPVPVILAAIKAAVEHEAA